MNYNHVVWESGGRRAAISEHGKALCFVLGVALIAVCFPACQNGCNPPAPVNLPAAGPGIAVWGDNRNGQLGDGSTVAKRSTAGAINLAGPWNSVAAGDAHVLVLKIDGTVWAWGANNHGQLGIGTTTTAHTPYTTQIDHVIAIAAGGDHSLALKSDGTVWAWGDNGSGELGDGTQKDSTSPVQVKGFALVRAVAIAAGARHSLAVDANGEVWSWGENEFGQLGNGSIMDSPVPVKVPNLANVASVAAGANHSLALKKDGTVWAWGDRRHLQIGDAANSSSALTPIQVPMGLPSTPQTLLTDVVAIVAGGDHSLALNKNNQLLGWGVDTYFESSGGNGLQVNGPDGIACAYPYVIQGTSGTISSIAAGAEHSLAVTSDGHVWVVGHNDQGQLGDASFTDRYGVVELNDVKGAKAVAAGEGHSVILATASLKASLSILDFGNVHVNGSADLTVIVRNDGFAPVNINSIVSSDLASFGVAPTCSVPLALTSGNTCDIRVTFHPANANAYTGTLFVNNDSPMGNLTVALKGSGTP